MSLFRRIGLYGGVAAILVSVLFPVAVAHAQTAPVRPPLSLITSPLPLNVVTKPGQTVTADIRVKNNGTQQEVLKIELLKFGAGGDTGRPQLLDRGPTDVYFDWVSFSENNFVAEPNVWKTIKMTIKAPKEAAFGYYFAVLFSRANPDKPTSGRSAVEGGVASLVLLTVDAPGARREARLVTIEATQKIYEYLPAHFTVKLHNSGNVHVAPGGTMFIKRGSTQVGVMNFNEERGNILPGTDRIFNLTWADGFPVYDEKEQNGKTIKKLTWDYGKIQKFRFGRYTANLVAVYDDGQRDVPVEAVVTFWVIPWRILGGIFLVALLVGAGVWAVSRSVWRSLRKQAALPSAGPDPNSLAAAQPTRALSGKRLGRPPKAVPEEPSVQSPIAESEPDPNSLAAAFQNAKRRGRPPKQSVVEQPDPVAPEAPRRGRPPKTTIVPSDDAPVAPRRGRPPKSVQTTAVETPAAPRRGRPPKTVVLPTPSTVTPQPEAPRRGRPPKQAVIPEPPAQPERRGRGRPRKDAS